MMFMASQQEADYGNTALNYANIINSRQLQRPLAYLSNSFDLKILKKVVEFCPPYRIIL